MGDFLQRLVERTLDPSAVVQPLISPFYAPETMASKAAPLNTSEENQFGQRELFSSPLAFDSGLRSVNGKMESVEPFSAKAKPERPDFVFPVAPGKQFDSSAGRDKEEKTSETTQDVFSLTTTQPDFEGSPEPANSVLMPLMPTINESYVPIVTEKITGTEAAPQKSKVIASLAEKPYSQPWEIGKQRNFENEHLSQTESPTIRVTIGRVDVRAVFPTEPAKQQSQARRPSPGLSLEDYLKSRNGGRE